MYDCVNNLVTRYIYRKANKSTTPRTTLEKKKSYSGWDSNPRTHDTSPGDTAPGGTAPAGKVVYWEWPAFLAFLANYRTSNVAWCFSSRVGLNIPNHNLLIFLVVTYSGCVFPQGDGATHAVGPGCWTSGCNFPRDGSNSLYTMGPTESCIYTYSGTSSKGHLFWSV